MLPITDVLVVGAGPTGLMLAGDLAAAGVSCAVLERRDKESNLTRAFGVHARTLELLDARGVADDLVATGVTVAGLGPYGRTLFRLPSRFPYALITPQYQTERILAERARAAGAEIVPGAEVVRVRQDPDGVELTVRDAGGAERTVRGRYAVGADGAHSVVRRELGLPFPGRAAVKSVMICDLRLEAPPETVTARSTGDGFIFVVPFGDGWHRMIAWSRSNQQPDTAPVDFEELRDLVRKVLGTDLGMHDPRWLARFHSDERQVPRYRDRRVFLAGDAAHIHSPAGGMGMNTGIQDAANLGWKLAAAVQGWAPGWLLDSYHDERHPVGQGVLRTSGMIMRGITVRSPILRTIRDLAVPLAGRLRPVARRAAGRISGIDLAYPAPPGAHPLTGRRAPDIRLAGDPGRLYHALRPGRFLLVLPPGSDPDAARPAEWADRVDTATAAGPTRTVVLVRPDAYIAWAADTGAGADGRAAAIRTALTEWCGPAAGRVAP